ncbi:HAD-IA family hydrolase [Methylotuvimicrobium buryatense]|uniref:Glycosyltransferase n=1 Tax=Methylotuvimicrobium buryatense TaxID=95641 RepID=A0A4V1IK83_METBY|nr:HAD-IA family hydrolase [Methylotuvimicrobium buryatense]QCW84005.1 glycosyltransferase [Methylotuvimicrobium buryatense]
MTEPGLTILQQANRALRTKDYSLAIELYKKLINQETSLKSMVEFNLNMAKRLASNEIIVAHDKSEEIVQVITPTKFQNKHTTFTGDISFKLNPFSEKIHSNFKAIEQEFIDLSLFDPDFYLQQNSDVKNSKMDPFWHFINFGYAEHRNPTQNLKLEYLERKYFLPYCYGINVIEYLYNIKLNAHDIRGYQFDIESLGYKPDNSTSVLFFIENAENEQDKIELIETIHSIYRNKGFHVRVIFLYAGELLTYFEELCDVLVLNDENYCINLSNATHIEFIKAFCGGDIKTVFIYKKSLAFLKAIESLGDFKTALKLNNAADIKDLKEDELSFFDFIIKPLSLKLPENKIANKLVLNQIKRVSPANINKNTLSILDNILDAYIHQDSYETYVINNSFNNKKQLIAEKICTIDTVIDAKNRLDFFEHRIKDKSIISFDIFDTLIQRSYLHPSAIFSRVEQRLKTEYKKDFNYKQFRIEAELAARKDTDKQEITLEDIYQKISELFDIDANLLDVFKRLEIEEELEGVSQKIFGIRLLELAKKQNKKIVFLSDMYLSKSSVKKLLKKAEIDLSGIDIYISSEIQKTKHHGSLFNHVLKLYNVTPQKWIHVGDNLHSDVTMAERAGMDAYLVPSAVSLFHKNNHHLIDEFSSNDAELAYASVFGQVAQKHYADCDASLLRSARYCGETYRLGYEALGPVFLGFLHSLYNTVVHHQYDKVFFISRDGFYLKEVYDLLRGKFPKLPESAYFFSSRLLSYSASLVDIDSILTVANKDYFPTTLRHLLTYRFGFTQEKLDQCETMLSQSAFTTYDDAVIQHKNHHHYIDFVRTVSANIIEINKSKSQSFKAYIEKSGMTNKSAIVDIGYAGSLQPTLKKIANISVEGIYFIVNKKINEISKLGLKYHTYIASDHPINSDFFNNVQLFELFFSATHPSVISIQKELQPTYDKVSFDSESNYHLSKLRHGAINFINDYLSQHKNLFVALNQYDASLMMKNILAFFNDPDELDCNNFTNIIFEDNFGANKYPLITNNRNILEWDDFKIQQHGYWASASRKLTKLNIALTPKEANSDKFADRIIEGQTMPAYRLLESKKTDVQYTAKHFHFVFKIAHERIKRTIDNLFEQVYPYWTATFIISKAISIQEISETLGFAYQRIQFAQNIEPKQLVNSIATDHFILVEEELTLEPDLLFHVANELNNQAHVLIYTDNDYKSKKKRQLPEFKPDFSPELLLSQPYYLGSLVYANRSLITNGSFECESLIDALAFTAAYQNKPVGHLAQILYHSEQLHAIQIDHSALINDYLTKLELHFDKVFVQLIQNERKVYSIQFPDVGPEIAIIIPTKNKFDVLKVALDSVEQTTYKNYKVYIINNESTDLDILEYFKTTKHTILPIASPNGHFSYSYINNEAAKFVKEDYVLFLNNDVKVITAEWLSQMAGLVQIKGIGSVGARLYYGNGKLQHVGIINQVSAYGLPAPALKLIEGDDNGYLNYAKSIKNFSAMTAACMLTPKKLFLDMGGFDDIDFSVAYNDCDYGFRLTQAGYRNVVAPNAELFHYEGVTRGIGVGNDKPSEEAAFIRKYKSWRDPFYNPNLTDEGMDFSVSSRALQVLPNQKFRCLFVTHNLKYEGAPLIMYEIAKGLKKQGNIEPIVLSPSDGNLREAYETEGIEVEVLDTNIMTLFSAKNERSYQEALTTVNRHIGRLNVNVVIANTILCHWAIESAYALGLPSNWVIHESEPPFEHLREHSKLVESHGKKAINYPYRVIFVANATKALFQPYNRRNNFMTIYNGFDSERMKVNMTKDAREAARSELNIEDKFVFICPGIVSKRKAQIDALKAYEKLPDDIKKKTVILIVGDRESHYSKQLHKYHQSMPKAYLNNIKVIKETKDIGKYYNASDAFLFTSHLESFPKVIQEAMYLGLPIVSTNTYGIAEQVHHNSSALLFDVGNLTSLANNIVQIVNNTALREKLKENAYAALDKLPSYEEMIHSYTCILQNSFTLSCSPHH